MAAYGFGLPCRSFTRLRGAVVHGQVEGKAAKHPDNTIRLGVGWLSLAIGAGGGVT